MIQALHSDAKPAALCRGLNLAHSIWFLIIQAGLILYRIECHLLLIQYLHVNTLCRLFLCCYGHRKDVKCFLTEWQAKHILVVVNSITAALNQLSSYIKLQVTIATILMLHAVLSVQIQTTLLSNLHKMDIGIII